MSVHPEVLEVFGLAGARPERLTSGLINASWRVETPTGERYILQRVNPLFRATVNDDIDAVTRHLEGKGMLTPRLVRTSGGNLTLVHDGDVWRLLTFISGISRDALEISRQAREAGSLLGRFHLALADLRHTFSSPRLGVHDTARHLGELERVLGSHRDHRCFDTIAPVAERILELASRLPDLPPAEEGIVHGDPKISNFIFDPVTDEAICLVDLDTVAPMQVILELGDAFRSWCNPAGEDTAKTEFSVPFFHAAVGGYTRVAADLLSDDEWRALPAATLTITLELASRFAADALRENYFGWDSARFESAADHNLVRAAGQLCLAESIRAQWESLHDS